jgi:hypothetical protein
MSNYDLARGAGIPTKWTSQIGIQLGERAAAEGFIQSARDTRFVADLGKPFIDKFVSPQNGVTKPDTVVSDQRLANWHVRDQGRRATCTAFAVTAMEELWNVTNSGVESVPDLSEEFLYYMSRNKKIGELNIGIPPAEVDALTRSGATFLQQAYLALREHGISFEGDAPYAKNAVVNSKREPSAAAKTKALRRRLTGDMVHNIVDSKGGGDVVGVKRAWHNNLEEGTTVSSILYDAIGKQRAIAAGFAVLNGQGRGAWFGATPFLTGQVKYPNDQIAATLQPIGGHAVCIVGFLQGPENSENPGWFVFRNSLGRYRFARNSNTFVGDTSTSLAGYGIVSAADVDRYCWEYLFHAHD